METKILVIYVGIAGIRSIDIKDYIQEVVKKIMPSTFEGETIIIPTQSYDTKIECINPKYITDKTLIAEHTELMRSLHEQLKQQLEILKEKNNNEKHN
jgi:hypothetical protein